MSIAEPRVTNAARTQEGRYAALQGALFESLVAATPASQRARLGLRYEQHGGLAIVACDRDPHLMLNRVAQVVGAAAVDSAELGAALARVRAPGHPDNFLVQLAASAAVDELAGLGLVPFRRDWLVLARSLAPAAPVSTRFRVLRASASDGRAFGELMAAGFDMSDAYVPCYAGLIEHPAWHVYVALDGAEVVAGGALFVHERTAYLGFAATLASHRGGGAHDALIALRIEQARHLGCDLLLAETGAPLPGEPSPSLSNMRTAGFEPAFVRKNFAPPGATWTGR